MTRKENDVKYELLAESDPHVLSGTVQRLLEKGWELYGNPAVTSFMVQDGYQLWHYQAVIKREADQKGE